MKIVGVKIERYLTAERRYYGGQREVTHHQVITELHATKGWREVSHERKRHRVKTLPSIEQWRAAHITVFRREPQRKPIEAEAGRLMRGRTARELKPFEQPDLMRHSWYRRKLRQQQEGA